MEAAAVAAAAAVDRHRGNCDATDHCDPICVRRESTLDRHLFGCLLLCQLCRLHGVAPCQGHRHAQILGKGKESRN